MVPTIVQDHTQSKKMKLSLLECSMHISTHLEVPWHHFYHRKDIEVEVSKFVFVLCSSAKRELSISYVIEHFSASERYDTGENNGCVSETSECRRSCVA